MGRHRARGRPARAGSLAAGVLAATTTLLAAGAGTASAEVDPRFAVPPTAGPEPSSSLQDTLTERERQFDRAQENSLRLRQIMVEEGMQMSAAKRDVTPA